jgi:hypothetical protein
MYPEFRVIIDVWYWCQIYYCPEKDPYLGSLLHAAELAISPTNSLGSDVENAEGERDGHTAAFSWTPEQWTVDWRLPALACERSYDC